MTNYTKILSAFEKLGYNQAIRLDEIEIKKALDEICKKNTGIGQFNGDVATEIWEQVDRQKNGSVVLKDYIAMIVKAQDILKENITRSEQQIKSGNLDAARQQELEECIMQYTDDLKMLTVPFQLAPPTESKVISKSRANMESSRLSGNGNILNGGFSGRSSGIFDMVPSSRQNSTSLKIAYMIALVCFMVELVVMYNKHHFYNVLVYLLIFSIIALGYFDKYYMRFVLFNLFFSVLTDLTWLVVEASAYWSPAQITQHSTVQTPFLRFIYFMVIFLMIARVILMGFFFMYRNNDENIRKSVQIFGGVYNVDGKIKDSNMISKLLAGTNNKSQSQ